MCVRFWSFAIATCSSPAIARGQGFDQQPIVVHKTVRPERVQLQPRAHVPLFFDAVSSFSSYPLRAIFVTGLVIATLSGLVGLEMIVRKIRDPDSIVLGFSSIIVSLWFLGGLMIFFLGVIGLYLSKVFVEVKDRPRFIVRKVYERADRLSAERWRSRQRRPFLGSRHRRNGKRRAARPICTDWTL
jgi:hypothetical protein